MISIDASLGEGGGQILRSSLALSLITGRPVRLDCIRARRSSPGLRPQHLKCVEAARAIGGARTEGEALGSSKLDFSPEGLYSGRFRFDIGTAGSTSLVLQTILLPLCLAGEAEATIVGGTHVPWSPVFEYLERQWIPAVREVGFDIEVEMERAGFYPRGGGIVRARVRKSAALKPWTRTNRGRLVRLHGFSAVANLPDSIAERQRDRALKTLDASIELKQLPALSPGTVLFLQAEFERAVLSVSALGARGKPAERVADEAVREMKALLDSEAAVDPHLADQMILPLALVKGESEFTACSVTEHLKTNIEIVRRFLPVDVSIEGGRVRVRRA